MLPAERRYQSEPNIGDTDYSGREPQLSGVLLLGALVIVLPYLMLIASFLFALRWSLQ